MTDVRPTHDALLLSDARLKKIFKLAAIGIAISDLDGRFLECNPSYCALTGYSEAELLERRIDCIIHPDDFDQDMRLIKDLKDNRVPSFEFDCRYICKSGQTVWVHKFVSILQSDEGHSARFIRLVTNVSERKQIEEELRSLNATLEQRVLERTAEVLQANERFELVAKATHAGVYDWDLLHDSVYFAPHWKKMHGFQETDVVMESSQDWAARIHPDDRERVLGRLQDYLARKHHEFWEEYRIIRKDGTSMWVLDRGMALWDEHGRAVRMVGAETDITWRKVAEEVVRQREHQFKTLADNVPAFFAYVDRDQRYRFVNKRYEELFGRSNQVLAGTSMRDLLGSEAYAEVQPHVEAALGGKAVSFEYRLPMPDASERWFSAQYMPDRSPDGLVMGLFILFADITLLKRSESALHIREEQLRDLSTKLLRAQEEERRWIARELHDDIMQRLAALALEMRSLRPSETEPNSVLLGHLQKLGELAERLTTDLQQMAHRLHPSILEHAGLEAAVREHVEEFSARTGLATEMIVRHIPETIPLDQATCLYRVLQESLQNVQKHADASNVLIRLVGTRNGLGICVHDDGRGFERSPITVGQKGLGLTSMVERVEALNGTFRLRTKPGDGTEVHAWVPLPR